MITFHYLALDQNGKKHRDTIQASSKSAAITAIEIDGLIPIEVTDEAFKAQSIWTKDIALFSRQSSDRDQANLAELLSNLYDAHLPIQDILAIAKNSDLSKATKKLLDDAQKKVAQGAPLSKALNTDKNIISSEFLTFIKIGDMSNTMNSVMMDASVFFKTRHETASKIKSALIYPCILLIASVFLIMMLVLFLVPTLNPVFSAANIPSPVLFSFAIKLQNILSLWWHTISITVILSACTLYWISQSNKGKKILGRLKYRLPLFGKITLLNRLASDSRFLALLMNGGSNLPIALEQMSEARSSDLIVSLYKDAIDELQRGGTFLSIIQDHSSILPKEYITFIGLAESTNSWGIVLKNLAKVLEAQVEQKRNQFLQLLTPAITLFIGLVIGLLVYSVIDAILQINDLAFTS